MKVVFFGSAGSAQSVASGNTSALVSGGGWSVLVDVSGSPGQSLLRAGVSVRDLDTIVLTHSHIDHLYALPSLLHQMWILERSKPLSIVGNHATVQHAQDITRVMRLWDRRWTCDIQWFVADDGAVPGLPQMQLSVFPVEHGVPALGLKIVDHAGALVYSGDTGPAARLEREATGARWLIHEVGNGTSDPRDNGHSTVREAAEVARRAAVERLFLCHIDYLNEEPGRLLSTARSSFTGDVVIPEAGRTYTLS